MLNPAYFDLIGQFNYLDIDERCQPAEAEQKILLLMFTFGKWDIWQFLIIGGGGGGGDLSMSMVVMAQCCSI